MLSFAEPLGGRGWLRLGFRLLVLFCGLREGTIANFVSDATPWHFHNYQTENPDYGLRPLLRLHSITGAAKYLEKDNRKELSETMADDPGRQPGNNMETPRRVWKPKAISDPGLQVETFAGQPYFRVPYYYLALPNEKIMLMHMQKDMGTVLDTRGSTLRTNTSRFMMNVEEFNPKTHLVVRSLHKLKVVTACNSPGVFMCDNSDLEGFDLITPKGLMILFRAKIDRLKYDKNKMAAPAMAGVCGQLFERLFDEMGDKGKQVVLDSTYGIKFGSYISRNTLNSIIMHGWLKADAITGTYLFRLR